MRFADSPIVSGRSDCLGGGASPLKPQPAATGWGFRCFPTAIRQQPPPASAGQTEKDGTRRHTPGGSEAPIHAADDAPQADRGL